MKLSSLCQSCGMPLKRDPKGGGSEKFGRKSKEYCSFCYQKGRFTFPKIKTAKDMQQLCIKLMKKQGVAGWKAWLFTRGIPRLNRWKKK